MPDFLLELLSEEIPARMQAKGAADLRDAVLDRLGEVKPEAAEIYSTPRRITLLLTGLPEGRPDRVTEIRGPRVGAPEQALAGFLRSAGLASIEACEIRDTGKGSFYYAVRTEPGGAIDAELAALIPAVLDKFPWPKSMRWGSTRARWVRPLHSILAVLFGDAGARVVPARWDLGGGVIEAGDTTAGHRFLAPERFAVTSFAQYRAELSRRFVVLDPAERRAIIRDEGGRLAGEQGLRVKDDPALLDEVAGLVECPVVRLGRIEQRFMALPPELLTTSMRAHQKYFACETRDGVLAAFFVVVGNNRTSDGGAAMVAGNERVLRARLSDAEFFWDLDRQTTLESRVPKLAERVFHAKLGSVLDKVERMAALAGVLVPFVPGAAPGPAERAVRLAKADLSSALVGEFPELQGLMGRYLALHDGEAPDVAEAVARHYAPAGLADTVPTEPLAIVAALADKIDTLAGFFAIGEAPTGSKDPYALRRAALGVIRIVLDNGLRLPLRDVFEAAVAHLTPTLSPLKGGEEATADALLAFIADRLKVALRERGVRHDLISAVLALGGEDDLVRLVARTGALQAFLGSEDGANLLTAYRRAAKIVGIEEKKDGLRYRDAPDPARYGLAEERALAERLDAVVALAEAALDKEEFDRAMAALASLRQPVDAFFDDVTVNVDDTAIRTNRLRLLARLAGAFDRVADFSKVEG